MKKSKRERKAFNEGKRAGYTEGYLQGLYDGNPFNKIVDACRDMIDTLITSLSDPEFVKMLEEARELEIVEGDDLAGTNEL